MEQNFKPNQNSFAEVELPKDLRQAVFARIEKEKIKTAQRKLIACRTGMTLSFAASIFSGAYFGKEILSSEFLSLVLLGFSDMKTVAVLWQDYVLSLLETLPTASIVMTLTPIFLFMIMIKQYEKIERRSNYSLKIN